MSWTCSGEPHRPTHEVQAWAGLPGTAHQELTLGQFPWRVVPKRKPVPSVCTQGKWAQWAGRFPKGGGEGRERRGGLFWETFAA